MSVLTEKKERDTKLQVNWRISRKMLELAAEESNKLGLGTIAEFVNFLLVDYFRTDRKA